MCLCSWRHVTDFRWFLVCYSSKLRDDSVNLLPGTTRSELLCGSSSQRDSKKHQSSVMEKYHEKVVQIHLTARSMMVFSYWTCGFLLKYSFYEAAAHRSFCRLNVECTSLIMTSSLILCKLTIDGLWSQITSLGFLSERCSSMLQIYLLNINRVLCNARASAPSIRVF